MFVDEKKGFILLDFDQFELLATRILLQDFCEEKQIMCRKCTHKNNVLNMVVQLMRA